MRRVRIDFAGFCDLRETLRCYTIYASVQPLVESSRKLIASIQNYSDLNKRMFWSTNFKHIAVIFK